MPFQPQVDQELTIDNVTYWIAEHPAAPGIPYGQEGRQAVVFQLAAGIDRRALKVFKPRYRLPGMVSLAERIAPLAGLSGLQVCQRIVLTPRQHAPLLRQHPDLTYAVLMPWVEGPTWMEVVVERRTLSPEESLALARSLAEILAGMEQRRLAHCDLSGPNVMLPALVQPATDGWRPAIAVVDVEQIYGPGLDRPEMLPGGSPGYAHKTAPQGLWGSTADRFAGAVLLAEMLGWCDERVREAAWGENYFEPQEMQRESERFQALIRVLRERWGDDVTGLFERAWRSDVLADCATFGEWLVTLPEDVPEVVPSPLQEVRAEAREAASDAGEAAVRALMEVGRRLEKRGVLEGALENYRQAQALALAGSGLAEELGLIVEGLEAQQVASVTTEPQLPLEQDGKVDITSSAPQPPEGETEIVLAPPLPDATEETDLDTLFDDGLAAYRRGEWAQAKELLGEVVRRQPDYERDEQDAISLLMEAESHLTLRRHRVPRWTLGTLVVVVLAGVAAIAILRHPDQLPMAFVATRDGNSEITAGSPTPAPEMAMAFVSTRDGNSEIYVADEKNRVVRLTYNFAQDADPDFSPGWTDVVFASDRDGDWEIYSVNVDGTGLMPVAGDPAHDVEPTWSPDGRSILFVSDRDGKREIYVLGPDGLGRATRTPGDGESWEPACMPDGTFLFTSDRDGKKEIYHLTQEGEVVRVTHTPGNSESWSPAPVPDGTILFTSDRAGKREIYHLTPTGEIVQVTHTPSDFESWSPAAAPDGTIFFTSDRNGKREVYHLTGIGYAEQVTHTPNSGESWSPTW